MNHNLPFKFTQMSWTEIHLRTDRIDLESKHNAKRDADMRWRVRSSDKLSKSQSIPFTNVRTLSRYRLVWFFAIKQCGQWEYMYKRCQKFMQFLFLVLSTIEGSSPSFDDKIHISNGQFPMFTQDTSAVMITMAAGGLVMDSWKMTFSFNMVCASDNWSRKHLSSSLETSWNNLILVPQYPISHPLVFLNIFGVSEISKIGCCQPKVPGPLRELSHSTQATQGVLLDQWGQLSWSPYFGPILTAGVAWWVFQLLWWGFNQKVLPTTNKVHAALNQMRLRRQCQNVAQDLRNDSWRVQLCNFLTRLLRLLRSPIDFTSICEGSFYFPCWNIFGWFMLVQHHGWVVEQWKRSWLEFTEGEISTGHHRTDPVIWRVI